MNSNRTAQITKLRTLLNDRPLDGVIICQQLGISQPTLSRLWKDAGIDVVSFGAARATRYGIARELPGIGSEVPIFRVDQKGNVAPLGLLRILQNNWYAFITDQGARLTLSEGLPFFMQDMRPQGFLGRLVPQHHSDLKLPDRIVDWTDDDVLTYLVKRGEDVGGDLVVGSEAYLRLLTHRPNTQGEIVEREFTPASIQATDLRYLPAAIRMADRFWQSVLTDAMISDNFKVIAEKHRAALMPLMPAAKMRMPSREPEYEENEALGGERP
jgi:hypothetical protein